ncbi:hypothetical protein LWC33_24060 [Pseudonocardia sp. RS11V-5]|uniref:hypothetical protein n=1 Tax=Pseudonocardia terrae TaxID=2905831 RepID=UPI001E48793F|nr:hypothetical protein [Pseudonocardia terrae]MCE3554520.1 hypothetical protein [Pseudonocardia terrae]
MAKRRNPRVPGSRCAMGCREKVETRTSLNVFAQPVRGDEMDQGQLTDVILSCGPEATLEVGWSGVTQRVCDVDKVDAGPASWQVKVNRARVGPGTIGWIHRWRDGGRLAALIQFTSEPYEEQEARGTIHYCDGILHHLSEPVASHLITSATGWTNKAPYTTNRARRFNDGVMLKYEEVQVLAGLLAPADLAWLQQARTS